MMQQLQLKSKTEYQTTITCPYHKDQYVNSICLDNACNDKLLCHACIKYNQEHNSISLPQFCNNLVEFMNLPDSSTSVFKLDIQHAINGRELNQKLQMFMSQAETAQQEVEQSHMQQFNVLFDRFTKNVNDSFENEKKKIVAAYKKTQDECFSQQSLLNKDFKDRACHLILSSVKKDNFLNLNSNIRKLHQGQLELAFAKEQIIHLFNTITNQVEHYLQRCLKLIHEQTQQIERFIESIFNKKAQDAVKLRREGLSTSKFANNFQKIFQTMRNAPGGKAEDSSLIKQSHINSDNSSSPNFFSLIHQKVKENSNVTVSSFSSTSHSQDRFIFTRPMKTEPNQEDYEYDDEGADEDGDENSNFAGCKRRPPANKLFYMKTSYASLRKQNSMASLKNKSLTSDPRQELIPDKVLTPQGRKSLLKGNNQVPAMFSQALGINKQQQSLFSHLRSRNNGQQEDLMFQMDISKQIVDAVYISDSTIITASINGEITSWFHKNHTCEKAWSVRGHGSMGQLSPYLPSSNVFFSAGLNESSKKVQVKLWVLQQNNNFIELVEFQDLHKGGIKYLMPYSDETVQKNPNINNNGTQFNDLQTLQRHQQMQMYMGDMDDFIAKQNDPSNKIKNIIYLATLGEDNYVRLWSIQYLSAQQLYSANCIQKLGQIGVISKNVRKLVFSEQDLLYFGMQNSVFKISIVDNQMKKDQELHVKLGNDIKDELVDLIIKKNSDKVIMISKHGRLFIYTLALTTLYKKFDIFQKLLNIDTNLLVDQEDFIVRSYNHQSDPNKVFLILKEKELYNIILYDMLQDCIVGRKQLDANINSAQGFLLFQDESFFIVENGNQIKLYRPFWK